MPYQLTTSRTAPSDFTATEALAAVLKAASTKCAGCGSAKGLIYAVMLDDATSADENAVLQAALNHDFNTRTTTQQLEAQRVTDFQALVSSAAQVISDIDAEIAVLNGSPTNAQVIAILKANEQRQKAMIKAILRIANL